MAEKPETADNETEVVETEVHEAPVTAKKKYVPIERLNEERIERHKLNAKLSEFEAKIAEQDKQREADRTKATDRTKRAELKAEAVKAGLTDPDMLKLLDLSKVEVDDEGEVTNAGKIIEEFKAAKPYAFAATNTSSTAGAPKNAPVKQKMFEDMSDAEKAAFKRERGIR